MIGLGHDSEHGAFIAEDIEVLPEHPEAIAVARRNREHSPRHEGVVIYDNGVARPRSTDRHVGSTALTFSDHNGKLYGFNNEPGGELGFRRMELDHDGVLVVSNTRGLLEGAGADIKFDDGRLYCSTGRVIDPEARTVLGTFPDVGHGALVWPDAAKGRVYFLTGDGTSRHLRVYDRNTYSQVAVLAIAGVHGRPSSLIRWGELGLAFLTDENQVFLIDSIPGL